MTKYLRPDPRKEYKVYVKNESNYDMYVFSGKNEADSVVNYLRGLKALGNVTTIYGTLAWDKLPKYVKSLMTECNLHGAAVWYVEA